MEHAAHKECYEIRLNTKKVRKDNLQFSLQEAVVFPPLYFPGKASKHFMTLKTLHAKQLSEIAMISV